MASPAAFAARLKRRGRDVERNAAKVLRLAVRVAGEAVVENTPVDTGLTRSNWTASVDGPDLSPRGIRSVEATVGEMRTRVDGLGPDREVHIANGSDKIPWLGRLNRGSSTQAPMGFLRISVQIARIFLGQQRLLSRR